MWDLDVHRFPVAFKLTDTANLPALSEGMLALKHQCVRDGKPYIRSAVGGKQTNKEGHDGGMQVVYLVEFEVSRGRVVELGGCGRVWYSGPWAVSLVCLPQPSGAQLAACPSRRPTAGLDHEPRSRPASPTCITPTSLYRTHS